MIETLERLPVREGASAAEPAWRRALRERGRDRFLEVGFPAPNDEEWRFTPLAPLTRARFAAEPAPAPPIDLGALDPFLFDRLDWPRLVFIDGRFAPALSLAPAGVPARVRALSQVVTDAPELLASHVGRYAGPDATPFTALNAALGHEGAVVEIGAGAVVDDPIHIVHVATAAAEGVALHPRLLVLIGPEARGQLVESYVTLAPGGRYFVNPVAEVVVGQGAWFEHSRIQRESEAAFHIAFTQVEQDRDSHYRSFSLAMGGAISRHNLHARLNAPNAESLLYGLYVGRGEQLVDTHTAIFHDHPDCRSWEVYKGLLDGRAHGVFNGKIFVQPAAQKTDAKQTNRALLLSEHASIDTKPQLEIFADDVKCTHGAAVGQLDEQAFFYLQARGVPRESARQLLTYAFAAEVLNEVASAPVRAALDRVVRARLDSSG